MENEESIITKENQKGIQFPDNLSLRDYFASKAMQGFLSASYAPDGNKISKDSYMIADAMLKERLKTD